MIPNTHLLCSKAFPDPCLPQLRVQQLCMSGLYSRKMIPFILCSQNHGVAMSVKIIRTDWPKLDSYSQCVFGSVVPVPQKEPTFHSSLLSVGMDVSWVLISPKVHSNAGVLASVGSSSCLQSLSPCSALPWSYRRWLGVSPFLWADGRFVCMCGMAEIIPWK